MHARLQRGSLIFAYHRREHVRPDVYTGRAIQRGNVESCNGGLRDKPRHAAEFSSLPEVRIILTV